MKRTDTHKKWLRNNIHIEEYRSCGEPFMKIYVKGKLVFVGLYDEYKIDLVYKVASAFKRRSKNSSEKITEKG